jgi:acetoacetate decarboxylase
MAYPSAPWTLRGFAFQTVQPLDIDRVRPSVPSDLEIVSIFPGKTLGGIYVSSYGSTSTLQYSELIVVSALVRQGARLGAWISHIYVDNPDSVAGGRDIWSLASRTASPFGRAIAPSAASTQAGRRVFLGFRCPDCRFRSRWEPSAPQIRICCGFRPEEC